MIVPLTRKTRWPPGLRSRAASGIQRYGSAQIDAPYSEIARSKLSSGSGTSSALASSRGKSRPNSACIRRAVSSWAGVMSIPTGRAPRRASQAEMYAVPQPSSIVSIPATSGSAGARTRERSTRPTRTRLSPTRAAPTRRTRARTRSTPLGSGRRGSSFLADDPDLLHRPLARPLRLLGGPVRGLGARAEAGSPAGPRSRSRSRGRAGSTRRTGSSNCTGPSDSSIRCMPK